MSGALHQHLVDLILVDRLMYYHILRPGLSLVYGMYLLIVDAGLLELAKGWSYENFKEVERDMENETYVESEQSEIEENDASSSKADDLDDLDYDLKDDEGFDEDEHILQDVHVNDGIDLKMRDKLKELRRIGKAKNHGSDKYYFYLGQ
uniref:Uncharacterized protein n=1 Tax=Tanacetum cinerariifolium TaxID=118510 RepID=A0A699II52_TANCI|nr:hypothetical protein [Tanacetum cinerariifolium]